MIAIAGTVGTVTRGLGEVYQIGEITLIPAVELHAMRRDATLHVQAVSRDDLNLKARPRKFNVNPDVEDHFA